MAFWAQYSTFARMLAKTLYCPKNTYLVCRGVVLSRESPKKSSGPGASRVKESKQIGLVFVGQHRIFRKKTSKHAVLNWPQNPIILCNRAAAPD